MASEDTKILGFQYLKSDKTPFIIYADLKSLIGKIDGCKNNPIKSSTTKVIEHIQSCFSMPTILSLKNKKMSMIYIQVKIARKNFLNP